MLFFLLRVALLLHGVLGLVVVHFKTATVGPGDTVHDYVETYSGLGARLSALYPKSVYGVPTINGQEPDARKAYGVALGEVALALYWIFKKTRP